MTTREHLGIPKVNFFKSIICRFKGHTFAKTQYIGNSYFKETCADICTRCNYFNGMLYVSPLSIKKEEDGVITKISIISGGGGGGTNPFKTGPTLPAGEYTYEFYKGGDKSKPFVVTGQYTKPTGEEGEPQFTYGGGGGHENCS